MAKSKHAPALFEVINKQPKVKQGWNAPKLKLPAWWKNRDTGSSGPRTPRRDTRVMPRQDVVGAPDAVDVSDEVDTPHEEIEPADVVTQDLAAEEHEQKNLPQSSAVNRSATAAAAEDDAESAEVQEPDTKRSGRIHIPAPRPSRILQQAAQLGGESFLARAGRRIWEARHAVGAVKFGRMSVAGRRTGEKRPIFAWVDGRLDISLNPVNASVLAGVLLLAIFTVYQLGALSGGSAETSPPGEGIEAGNSIEQARNQSPQPEALEVGNRQLTASRTRANQPVATPQERVPLIGSNREPGRRIRGLNYVIIERFLSEHLEDAKHAQEWLASQDVQTTLEKGSDGAWLMISAEGFDYSKGEKEQSEQFARQIKELGLRYREAHKGVRYKFHEPYPKKYQ